MVDRLRRSRVLTFRTLVADCPTTLHVVARFLSLLELYREKAVAFEQVVALGELTSGGRATTTKTSRSGAESMRTSTGEPSRG